jgi:hypothetical protein
MSNKEFPFTASVADHWSPIEIDQLKDDLESAEVAEARATKLMNTAKSRATKHLRNYNNLQKTMETTISEANSELSAKAMIYLSLIKEYEVIIAQYAGHHGIKLTTTDIDSLRKRGGLIV